MRVVSTVFFFSSSSVLLLSFRFLFDQSFRVKPGLNNTLICLRFDSLINLVVRTKVENILSHYLSDVVVVDPKVVVNAVFMFACTRVCKSRLHSSLSLRRWVINFNMFAIYIHVLVVLANSDAQRYSMRLEDVQMCTRTRTLPHTNPLHGQFRYTGATLLCSVNNNVMAII